MENSPKKPEEHLEESVSSVDDMKTVLQVDEIFREFDVKFIENERSAFNKFSLDYRKFLYQEMNEWKTNLDKEEERVLRAGLALNLVDTSSTHAQPERTLAQDTSSILNDSKEEVAEVLFVKTREEEEKT